MRKPKKNNQLRLSLHIKNKQEEIQQVIKNFGEFASILKLNDETVKKVDIALDELLANIISYAYTDTDEHLIDVTFEIINKKLVLTISDDGIEFDPFARAKPDINLSVDERNIGGLGIHLVKNLMGEYSYKRKGNRNIITLITNIEV